MLEGRAGGMPAVGKEVIEMVVRMSADTCEQVAKIGERLDMLAFAGSDEAA